MVAMTLSPSVAKFFWILFMAGAVSMSGASDPEVTLEPAMPYVAKFVNESYVVSCRAPENSERVVWTKGNKEITNTTGRVHVEYAETDQRLVFEAMLKRDQGIYVCKALVDGKQFEKKFNLSIFKPISFEDTPVMQYANEGQDSLIRCNVGGDATLSVTWKIRGRSIRNSLRHEVQAGGLMIKEVTLEDAGIYSCRALLSNPMATSFKDLNITLKIHHKPRWLNEHTEEAFGFIGGAVNLSCSAMAEPGAEFTWIKDNKTLQRGDGVEIYSSEHLSTLQIAINDESVFGDYECRATNLLGTMARVVVLSQVRRPVAPTFRIKEARSESLVLDIEDADLMADRRQDGHKLAIDVTGYTVQLRTSGQDWETAQQTVFDRSPGKVYSLTNLKQATAYEIRVAARTAAGPSEFSQVKSERTKKMDLPAVTVPTSTSSNQAVGCLMTLVTAALCSALVGGI